jgi:molybdenum cofactor cytidylyltransferase
MLMLSPPVFPALAAILLAAGSSRRYGEANKLLACVEGRPLVAHVAAALTDAGLASTIVVTGHDAALIAQALAPVSAGLRYVHNHRHAKGMGTSIAAGVAALPSGIDGVLIAQGDMPGVNTALVNMLARRFTEAGSDRITAPWLTGHGRFGNPVVWPRRLFPALAALTGDIGGKALLIAEAGTIERVAIADHSAATDIDTPDQLAAYSARNPPGTN